MVALVAGEVLLRVIGHGPWKVRQHGNEPVMFEEDPVLGWRNREGTYEYAGYRPGDPPVRVTILPGGARTTGAGDPDGAELLIVGGSFAQGWAISDEETFGWKLQRRLPRLRVVNLSSGGYGTYQALLSLEEHLRSSQKVRIVLYGFMDHHEIRNVAPARWMRDLSRASRGGQLAFPYCEVDASGALVRHPPDRYADWPIKESSAIVTALERVSERIRTRGRWKQRRTVTEALLVTMRDRARAAGAHFAVVLLDAAPEIRDHYSDFMKANQIEVIDCLHPVYPIPREYRVDGEWHPSGALNTRWAEKILQSLQGLNWI